MTADAVMTTNNSINNNNNMTPPNMADDAAKYRALDSSTDSLGLPTSPTKDRRTAAPHLHHSGYLSLAGAYLGGYSTHYAVVTGAHLDLYASKHAYQTALTADLPTVIASRTRVYIIGAHVSDGGETEGRRFRVDAATGHTYKFLADNTAMKRSWMDVIRTVSVSAKPPQSVLNRKQCAVCQTRLGFFSKGRECAICCRMTCGDCVPSATMSVCQKCAANTDRVVPDSREADSDSGDQRRDSHSHSHSVTHQHRTSDDVTSSSPSLSQRALNTDRTTPIPETAQLILSPHAPVESPPPPLPIVYRYLTVSLPPSPRGTIQVLSEEEAKRVVDKDTRLRAQPIQQTKAQPQQVIRPTRRLSSSQSAYKFPIREREIDVESRRTSSSSWWLWCSSCA